MDLFAGARRDTIYVVDEVDGLAGRIHIHDIKTFINDPTLASIVIAADLTARSGTLGPAIAVHFVNNVIGILIVGTEGHLSGMALAVVPFGPDDTELMRYAMLIEVPMLLCMWLAARIAIRR